ncbi:uncharacterized protein LOC111714769 [Eurytemora carolleeae]|uniref:uncharacterized protein LOC111714769 n=1 Tax=Eurytemora carolleeae TaxID=1294199 RepID=UPI000C788763|nr:uncharacterized protein LOC111714769 [Eurytemora carolleeae]|eukprot:XP_023345737.1 uncharacterized protein LOC111714769 [Eurytemora affinis]
MPKLLSSVVFLCLLITGNCLDREYDNEYGNSIDGNLYPEQEFKQAGSVAIEEAEAAVEDIPNDIFDPLTTEITVAGITITPALVYIGTLLPENILIHIAQNAVNFFCSTLFWFFLMSVTQGTTGKRKRRSTDEIVEEYFEDGLNTVLGTVQVDGDTVAWVFRQFANTAEQYKRLKDEL